MKFTCTIEMDNAAFDDGNGRYELARILGAVVVALPNWSNGRSEVRASCWDSHGNAVGKWRISK